MLAHDPLRTTAAPGPFAASWPVDELPLRIIPPDLAPRVGAGGSASPGDVLRLRGRAAKSVPASAIQVPGEAGQSVSRSAELTGRRARFRNEVGLFVVDDPSGRVGTLRPGDRGYARAALARRVILFHRGRPTGTVARATLAGGSHFGTYLIQDSTSDRFLAGKPGARSGRRPMAFFSFPAANADRFAHVIRPRPGVLAMEDQSHGGDRDFNDVVLRLRFDRADGPGGTPSPTPEGPPVVSIDAPAEGRLSNANLTISGRVSDDRSGVASLQAQVDGGPLFDVAFDAAGAYGFPTALRLGGADDGPRTIRLRAADRAGLVSEFVARSFALDTVPPPVALTLDPASDTAPVGDSMTTETIVTLVGQTEPNLAVTLADTGATTVADAGGRFVFAGISLPLGSKTFTATATDAAGNVGAGVREITRCGFDEGLAGWTTAETGGTDAGRGGVAEEGGLAVLREGDSFEVRLQRGLVVPAGARSLSFEYVGPSFDVSDPNFINDAFEAALVDASGVPLVPTFATGRDAFFNLTEGQAAALGSRTTVAGRTVTVNLEDVPAGSSGRLIFRLVNNDSDTETTVRVACVDLPEGSSAGVAEVGASRQAEPRPGTAPVVVGPESAAPAGPAAGLGIAASPDQTEAGDTPLDADGRSTFTTTADFDLGTSFNTNAATVADELRLNAGDAIRTFDFIWIAISDEGVVSKDRLRARQGLTAGSRRYRIRVFGSEGRSILQALQRAEPHPIPRQRLLWDLHRLPPRRPGTRRRPRDHPVRIGPVPLGPGD